MGWLQPEKYADDAYQQQNSIMAIGSGQLLGKGLYNTDVNSVKNGNFISEPQTDFIFAVVGEEMGFLGSALIIILLLLITIECIIIAKRAKDLSGRLLCCGVVALIGFQSFVNICVVTGLMPNTGLPLPFVSYGLTSLVSSFIAVSYTHLDVYKRQAYAITLEDNGVYNSRAERNKALNKELYRLLKVLDKNKDQIRNDFYISYSERDGYQYTVSGTTLKRFLADIYDHKSTDDLKYNKTLGYNEAEATPEQVMEYLSSDKRYGISDKYSAYNLSLIHIYQHLQKA